MMSGRVLTEEGPKGRCKCKAGLDIDLDLVDAGNIGLDRVFDGQDIDLGLIELRKGGVEGRGLA